MACKAAIQGLNEKRQRNREGSSSKILASADQREGILK
jgi:hypothetical protein